eukprot:gene13603-4499_t
MTKQRRGKSDTPSSAGAPPASLTMEILHDLMILRKKNIALFKLQYFGHAIRRGGLEATMIQGDTKGRRPRGRPSAPWKKDIQN